MRAALVGTVAMPRELPGLVPVRVGAMAALVVARTVMAREVEDGELGLMGGVVRIVMGVELGHVHNLLLEGMAVAAGWLLDTDLLLLQRRSRRFVVPDPASLNLTVLLLRTIAVVM